MKTLFINKAKLDPVENIDIIFIDKGELKTFPKVFQEVSANDGRILNPLTVTLNKDKFSRQQQSTFNYTGNFDTQRIFNEINRLNATPALIGAGGIRSMNVELSLVNPTTGASTGAPLRTTLTGAGGFGTADAVRTSIGNLFDAQRGATINGETVYARRVGATQNLRFYGTTTGFGSASANDS